MNTAENERVFETCDISVVMKFPLRSAWSPALIFTNRPQDYRNIPGLSGHFEQRVASRGSFPRAQIDA